jgi:hypothetical protein
MSDCALWEQIRVRQRDAIKMHIIVLSHIADVCVMANLNEIVFYVFKYREP